MNKGKVDEKTHLLYYYCLSRFEDITFFVCVPVADRDGTPHTHTYTHTHTHTGRKRRLVIRETKLENNCVRLRFEADQRMKKKTCKEREREREREKVVVVVIVSCKHNIDDINTYTNNERVKRMYVMSAVCQCECRYARQV